jgi:predicted dinucleotide-binding enzyme
MKVGIFGTGTVGRILAEKFVADGNEVMIGTRNVENTLAKSQQDSMGNPPYKEWQKSNPKVQLGTFADTAGFGEIIFIATFGDAATSAIEMADKENLADKVVIDVTNPLDVSNGVPPSFSGTVGNSLGEQIQNLLPKAKVVKAFNTVPMHVVVDPKREEGDPTLFIAGNNENAKKQVDEIAKGWGWEDVVDLGDISESFLMEALGMIGIHYGFKNNSWTYAFALLRK